MHSYIEISAKKLQGNIAAIKKHTEGKRKIIAIVKANAYGHGVKEVVSAIENSVDSFAIDDINELRELQPLTNKDIYVLGYISHEDISEALSYKAILVVYDLETLHKIDKEAKQLGQIAEINIKIDALLGRQGLFIDNLKDMFIALQKCSHIRFRGLYAHFANIEDTDDPTHAQKQIRVFDKACLMADAHGYSSCEKHISSTAGSLIYDTQSSLYTHIRLGLGMYGYWPSEGVRKRMEGNVSLEPTLRWVSHIAQVKAIPKGFSIGYGCTYIASKDMTIAIIPQGYSDGYDRELSNNADVLIGGVRAPVCGRIAMNMFVVDVTNIPDVKREDEVVLIGKQGSEDITAHEIAEKLETIEYEVLSRISPLLERRLV